MTNLRQLLESITSYKSENEILNHDDFMIVQRFIKYFISCKKRTVVFRGTNKLKKDLCANDDDFPKYLFMLGDKSLLFKEDIQEVLSDSFSDEDSLRKSAELLFDKLHTKFTNPSDVFIGDGFQKFQSFETNNPSFVDFFRNKTNKELFIEKLNKVEYLDYYYAFIHTIGTKEKEEYSQFQLSTSCDVDQAEKFRNNGIILIGWIPNTKRGFQIKYEDVGNYDRIKDAGLPYYESPLYPEQKEMCLKYGLLPHFILGYLESESLEINHHLIENLKQNIDYDEIICNGISINQKNFNNVLYKTKFKNSYVIIDNCYYRI